MGTWTHRVKESLLDARAGLEKYVTVRHNRPRLSQAPLMLYKATYENEEEAALAMLVLDASGALAVHAKGADVVAVVSRPLATGNLHASAMAIHQPLFEAGLEPKVAFVHPSARVPSLTWHTASLGHNWRPDESELKALTSLPAQLGKANEILPVPGHPRLQLTDHPDVVYAPWSLGLTGLFAALLVYATGVGLAGSDGWFSPGIGLTAISLSLSAFSFWSTQRKEFWARALFATGILAVAYAFGIWWAKSSSAPISWASFGASAFLATLYVGVVLTVYTLLRRSQLAGRAWLALGTIVAAALGATTWIAELLSGQFEVGLGQPNAGLQISTLDLLMLTPEESLLALLGFLSAAGGAFWLRGRIRAGQAMLVLGGVPLIFLILFSLTGPLFPAIEQAGARVRAGILTGAGRGVACVLIGQTSDGPVPTQWSDPGVLVGPVSGPAVFFDSKTGTAILSHGGLTARPVEAAGCRATSP